jgi:expansin (peptidoglycan-binding protein)
MRRWLTVVVLLAGWCGVVRAAPCDGTVHEGRATYYDFADGSGVCGYPPATGNQMVVALDAPELAATAMCGACIHVQGPSGEVTVLVVNGCPGCEVGHLDLSPQAYQVIAAGYNGVPPITWQYVPCDVTGPIRYAYFAGSTTSFAWVQVRNHRHPIATFEARQADGSYALLARADWGYFNAQNLPAGGQTYRVTDIYGHVLEDTGIPVLDQGEVAGQGQFPPCSGSGDGGGPAAAGAGGAGCGCAAAPRRPASGLLVLAGLLVGWRRRPRMA